MATHPKVLGLTLDPSLTYSTHIHNISVQAHKPLQIIKTLTATGWGKQKETLMSTYKAVMRPVLEYASYMWSPLASSTSINKLQVMQNTALRTATGCTQDTTIQHMHAKTLILPIHEHLQLHASQYKQKTQHPSHSQETKWIKTTRKYIKVTKINFNDIRLNSKEYLKQCMIKWDRNIWEDELEMKTSLQIYKNKTLVKKKFLTIGHHQPY